MSFSVLFRSWTCKVSQIQQEILNLLRCELGPTGGQSQEGFDLANQFRFRVGLGHYRAFFLAFGPITTTSRPFGISRCPMLTLILRVFAA